MTKSWRSKTTALLFAARALPSTWRVGHPGRHVVVALDVDGVTPQHPQVARQAAVRPAFRPRRDVARQREMCRPAVEGARLVVPRAQPCRSGTPRHEDDAGRHRSPSSQRAPFIPHQSPRHSSRIATRSGPAGRPGTPPFAPNAAAGPPRAHDPAPSPTPVQRGRRRPRHRRAEVAPHPAGGAGRILGHPREVTQVRDEHGQRPWPRTKPVVSCPRVTRPSRPDRCSGCDRPG